MAYPSITIEARNRARRLRRNQTDAEQKLWQRLRGSQINGAKFRRQQSIGPYFADFCCEEHGLIIELDGSQHAVNAARDQARTGYLQREGYRVLRFWDHEVLKDMDAVVERIAVALKEPSPQPSPRGRGSRKEAPRGLRSPRPLGEG